MVPVAGAPLVVHATRNLLASGRIDTVLIDVSPVTAVTDALARHGIEPDSVLVGPYRSLPAELCSTADVLLVHEVTRAFAPPELIGRVVDAVSAGAGSVVPVLPCSDTVKRLDAAGMVVATEDRTGLRVAQTPRGFAGREAALRWLSGRPDDLATQVTGHPDARAIHTAFDIAVAEAALARAGTGGTT